MAVRLLQMYSSGNFWANLCYLCLCGGSLSGFVLLTPTFRTNMMRPSCRNSSDNPAEEYKKLTFLAYSHTLNLFPYAWTRECILFSVCPSIALRLLPVQDADTCQCACNMYDCSNHASLVRYLERGWHESPCCITWFSTRGWRTANLVISNNSTVRSV